MNQRQYTPFDRLMLSVDNGLRTLFGKPVLTERANPAATVAETELESSERDLAGRLMRINHCGEVSAQGLYQGQALTARLPEVREKMERAALEENDHLAWCEQRIHELGTHKSLLNPVWYFGSMAIGAAAGIAGDKWSLGFVAETEHQVIKHLDSHLAQVPARDQKTRAILEQMKEDEAHHATVALQHGGEQLPWAVKKVLMPIMSKVMTRTAYWI
jgi:ubiquinone biosynthesis monooxygenase Coq7